jgi:hypothetical protein
MTGQGHSHGPPIGEPGPANLNVFPHKSALLQTEILLCFMSCPGGLSHTIPAGEEAECGGPGLVWLHIVYGCDAGWTYYQIL